MLLNLQAPEIVAGIVVHAAAVAPAAVVVAGVVVVDATVVAEAVVATEVTEADTAVAEVATKKYVVISKAATKSRPFSAALRSCKLCTKVSSRTRARNAQERGI
jgi:hypothetical protein